MSLRETLDVVIEAAREAGALLRAEAQRKGGPRGSGEVAPVDLEAEQVIRERLMAMYACGFLGVNSGMVGNVAPGGGPCFVVDPHDGTAAWLAGVRGSSVSIALVDQGRPIVGAVYAFDYPDDGGDLIAWAEGCGPPLRNGKPVEAWIAGRRLDRTAVVLVSFEADRNPAANMRCVQPARYLAMPSVAYRLALVGVGEGVAAVHLNAAREWDYAAGHAILRATGGVLCDDTGRQIEYRGDGTSNASWCFGGAPDAVAALVQRPWHEVFERPRTGVVPFFELARASVGKRQIDPARLSRAHGCLLGQLSGDALGSLVEFQKPADIARRYPEGVRELTDGGTHDTLAGQPTDDSEMALLLARAVLKANNYDQKTVLAAYLRWYLSRPFDIGKTIKHALSSAASGATPDERLEMALGYASKTSEANGALMRISPLGIFGAGRAQLAAQWARLDAELTHPHNVCRESNAAFVVAIAAAIDGATAREAHAAALAEARRGGHTIVVKLLNDAQSAPPADYLKDEGWVLVALQNAFYQLLNAPSFEAGLVATVMQGGDSDTNAAIAGALLGAVHGRDAIPSDWRRLVQSCRPIPEAGARHVRPIEMWPVDALVLAENLLYR